MGFSEKGSKVKEWNSSFFDINVHYFVLFDPFLLVSSLSFPSKAFSLYVLV